MAMVEMLGVLVPADQIAKIIGKAGAGLKQIREAAGVKIQVQSTADPNASTRRVDLIGQTERIIGAFQLLLNKAFSEGTASPSLLIPSDKAGQVVGKGGENLKRVREECHVRLTMERDPVTDPTSGAQERMLTMQGETSQMARALRYILGATLAQIVKLPSTLALPTTPAAPIHSGVRAASSDPDEIQLQVTIPDKFAGAILGKAGAQVKQTAVTAGCKVSMTARGQGERRAVIAGTYSQCVVAQGLLYDQLLEAARMAGQEISEISVVFLIRKEAAGAIIGKAGATLKQIRESSGAKIQLAREEIEEQRPCTLTGTIQSIMHAEKAIFDLVRNVPVTQTPAPQAYAGAAFPGTPYKLSAYTYDPGVNKRSDAAVQQAPTAKRQRVDDPTEPTTKLLVPSHCAGAVIGKQAAGLKEIRETTGAHVDLLPAAQAPHWPNDRLVILKGSAGARQAAVLSVLRMAFQTNSPTCTLKMLVTGPQAGSIIGKQGSTLKYLREQSGVSVQVEREEFYGERLVTAVGSQSVIFAAVVAICTVLDSQSPTPAVEAPLPQTVPPPLTYETFAVGMAPLAAPGAYVQ